MKKISIILLLVIASVLLIILLAFPFGQIINWIDGGRTSVWIGSGDQLSYIAGLFMAYAFAVSFMLSIFGKNKKYLLIIILTVLELIFFYKDLQWILIIVITALIGWLLGEGILRLYKLGKK